MPPAPFDARLKDYLDWAVKGAVTALSSGAFAAVFWGLDAEVRLDAHDAYASRLSSLEARDEAYDEVRIELAVLKSQQADNTKKLDRIEGLLLQIANPR